MKLRNALKHVSECSEHGNQENSPEGTPECPDEPGGETVVEDDLHTCQEGSMGDTNEDGGGTTGGPIGDQVELGVVEGNPDYGKVVDGAGCDRIRPRSVWNERVNVPCRDEGLGGASELDRETSRAVGSAGAMAKATRRMGYDRTA